MKIARHILLILTLILVPVIATAKAKQVYVIPVDDEIGSTTWRTVQQGCREARELDTDILLIHLNTYGGAVVYADSIRTALLNYPKPVIAFIDNNAASAGALISIACDSIYMRDGGSIGAATVVGGDGRQMPDKYQSYMRAMMRSTAQATGRDPMIAEAMVDSRVEIPGIIDSTRVLTFTSSEARQHGFSNGNATDIDNILRDRLHIDNYTITTRENSFWDLLIGFFTNPAVQAILIMIIIGGIYFELQSPGMGFPSAAALIAAILYFLPLYIEGVTAPWVVAVFLLGLVLLILEIFVIPGFGIAGIVGIALMIAGLFAALLDGFSFSFDIYTDNEVMHAAATVFGGLLLGIGAVALLTWKFGYKLIPRRMALHKSLETDKGYIGVDMQPSRLVGQRGRSVTVLRPAGKVEIGNTTYDAVSTGSFIDRDTEVRVERYENAQLYVTPIDKDY
ncbi:MAG: hypothetical protein NC117_06375 [Pseudoflavonifractor sp.]|nr:hypothetical protein [Pseudoflavonifractor sp.]